VSLLRERLTRTCLWISVLAWGILLGGRLFDLRVLVGAWSANPPESLSLLPYGPRFPVDVAAGRWLRGLRSCDQRSLSRGPWSDR